MSAPATSDAANVPLHVLFPESYEATKRMILRDFSFLAAVVVAAIVGAAWLNVLMGA